jgi:plastocyanin domain-containing protein
MNQENTMQSSILVLAALVLSIFAPACNHSEAPAPAAERQTVQDSSGRLSIEVTDQGFVPATATVKVGKPVILAVTRKTQRTCATDIVISEYAVNKPLPLNETVEITLTPQKAGKIHFACPMDMITGDLTAE